MTTYTETLEENHTRAADRAREMPTLGTWVGGQTGTAESGDSFPVEDPAVCEPIVDVPRCRDEDVANAVETARAAYETEWAGTTATERARSLQEWVAVLHDHVDELALLETLEVGKPLTAARADVENGLDFFEYYANVAVAQEGEQLGVGGDTHAYTRHEPYGVAGQILPWNYPVLLMGWKVGAALAAGNTSVVKPPEQAPLAIVRAAQLSKDVLPDGVLNVVTGYGEEAGKPLTEHADVDKLSFTGSVPVGKEIMGAAAERVTPVTLELGGKNPFVVFPDADLEAAAANAAVGGLYNGGQSCDSASRIIVHEDVKAEFMEQYLAAFESYEPGDPLAEGTDMGPMCFDGQCEKVETYVEIGREEGATVLTGGGRPDGELADGWYVEPTVFDDVEPDMRIAQEEIFGPVQMVLTFSTYEEAVELANGVDYGLVAGVATENSSTVHRAAADIEAGSVWVNEYFGTVPGTPFGGFDESGVGRECAQETLSEYTRTKSVTVSLDDPSY